MNSNLPRNSSPACWVLFQRTTINQICGALHAEGIIDTSRGHITILQLEALRNNACECYGILRKRFATLFPNWAANVEAALAVATDHKNQFGPDKLSEVVGRSGRRAKMTRYYFDLREGDILVVDEEEPELPDIELCTSQIPTPTWPRTPWSSGAAGCSGWQSTPETTRDQSLKPNSPSI